MADVRLSDLPTATAITDDDYLIIVDTPGGTPNDKKITALNAQSYFWSPSMVNAKGDLIVGTADNTVARLAVGTNGLYLRANSATTTGLEWAAAAGGSSSPDESFQDHGNAGATETVDYSLARTHKLTLDANLTLSWTGWPASGSAGQIELWVYHDATTNARTLTWPSSARFPNGTQPEMPTTTSNALTRFVLTTIDGGTNVMVDKVGQDYA